MSQDTPPEQRPTVGAQAAWALGQAQQHARLASRAVPGSAAQQLALRRERIARAAARTLQSLQPRKRK